MCFNQSWLLLLLLLFLFVKGENVECRGSCEVCVQGTCQPAFKFSGKFDKDVDDVVVTTNGDTAGTVFAEEKSISDFLYLTFDRFGDNYENSCETGICDEQYNTNLFAKICEKKGTDEKNLCPLLFFSLSVQLKGFSFFVFFLFLLKLQDFLQ